jgi:hypothetical protein
VILLFVMLLLLPLLQKLLELELLLLRQLHRAGCAQPAAPWRT